MTTLLLVATGLLIVLFFVAPRPRLDPRPPLSRIASSVGTHELDRWLARDEAGRGNVIEGAEASIVWHADRTGTEYCLLYLHGFSACRQETAPLTEEIARHIGANVVYARLAGHGLRRDAMQAVAEDWLASVRDAYDIAARLGERVIIIATSTGAPLAVWASHHLEADSLAGMIFCSPNFKVRNPFGFLLTWPLAPLWLPWIAGKEYRWEPENERVARYWTCRYDMAALTEMQKLVDWARRHRKKISAAQVPLQTLYMTHDPTIDVAEAVRFHQGWGADYKELHEVTLDREHPQHVFVGRITAPHRLPWTVKTCTDFIRNISARSPGPTRRSPDR